MAITSRQEVREAPVCSRYGIRKVVAIGVAIGCVLGAGNALAGGDGRFCSATATSGLPLVRSINAVSLTNSKGDIL